MLKGIIERNKKLSPLSQTEIRIIKGAVKLFLENGFSNTTLKMIQEETGVKLGNITYYFRTKEDIAKVHPLKKKGVATPLLSLLLFPT